MSSDHSVPLDLTGCPGLHPIAREQVGHFADPAYILLSVIRRESQIRAKPMADIIAVEQTSVFAKVKQFALQLGRNRGLARGRQTCQPHHASVVTVTKLPLAGADL